jgi:tetratricopeptide (TPR) repeat protein
VSLREVTYWHRTCLVPRSVSQDRGNESLKLGTPFHCRQAAACYSQALAQGLSDPKANSVFYANRAQAHLQLRNWGKALADGRAAVELHPGNVKAAFRAAKAAAQLGKHDEVLHMCAIGMQSA